MSNTTYVNPHEHHPDGVNRVLMRVHSCNCGCKGRDPWHRSSFMRKIQDVKTFEQVMCFATQAYGLSMAIAEGVAKLPRGLSRVVFVVSQTEDGKWHRLGWCYIGNAINKENP